MDLKKGTKIQVKDTMPDMFYAHMRPALRRAPWVHWFGV
jgi:hypothetical protein